MNIELILTVLSAIISVAALTVSIISISESRRILKQQVNIDLIKYGHDLIIQNPEILNLHGVNVKELQEKYNVDIKTFIYVLNSFYAGQAYYEISKEKIHITEYRRQILEQNSVKEIWKDIIRDNLIYRGEFSNAIDEYYKIK